MQKYLQLLFVALFASMSFILTSCGKSPVDESLAVVDEAIEKINKAEDVYELIGIANTMKADLNAINAANRDYKPTEAESQQIKDKLNEVMRVYMNRTMELSYGDTPAGEQAKELVNKMLPK